MMDGKKRKTTKIHISQQLWGVTEMSVIIFEEFQNEMLQSDCWFLEIKIRTDYNVRVSSRKYDTIIYY